VNSRLPSSRKSLGGVVRELRQDPPHSPRRDRRWGGVSRGGGPQTRTPRRAAATAHKSSHASRAIDVGRYWCNAAAVFGAKALPAGSTGDPLVSKRADCRSPTGGVVDAVAHVVSPFEHEGPGDRVEVGRPEPADAAIRRGPRDHSGSHIWASGQRPFVRPRQRVGLLQSSRSGDRSGCPLTVTDRPPVRSHGSSTLRGGGGSRRPSK
jgi:hypothetical protein